MSEYSLASLHDCFTCRGRRQVILNYNHVTVQSGKQHTMNSFIVDGVFYWTAVVWKKVLPVSLLGHLDYGSLSYDLGLYGTSMSGICHFMAEQY